MSASCRRHFQGLTGTRTHARRRYRPRLAGRARRPRRRGRDARHDGLRSGAPGSVGGRACPSSLALRWDLERRIRLFEALVEHARLDRESGGRLGERFLDQAQGTIDGLAASGGLDLKTALSLACAYARAEIDAPEALASFLLTSIADEAEILGRLRTIMPLTTCARYGQDCLEAAADRGSDDQDAVMGLGANRYHRSLSR